ncbi:IclR family transcriptional regulator [Actinokineospora iranica]|uniref:IclR family transcriptional regulator n=1 Tax=Actinokineospora iranica TaxID=1271860 RepID=UPI001587B20D|nr:IclR family transcriptional regulator [Actinokineospora iranica]
MSDLREQNGRTGAQAIERALAVLRCFETGEVTKGVSEIARLTGLSVSTTHRLTRALTDGGLLMRAPRGDRYQLGPALLVLGMRAAEQLGYDQVLPVLQELAAATGESVNLGIRAGREVQVVLDVASSQPLRFDQARGTRVPLHTSAMGKCLIAGDDDLAATIDHLGDLARLTRNTITSPDALHAELRAVRDRGWALNDEERVPGVRAVAVPVRDSGERVLAAIAVQGPAVRLTEDRFEHVVELSALTAAKIAPLLQNR